MIFESFPFIKIGLILTPFSLAFGLFYLHNNKFRDWFDNLFEVKDETK